MCVPPPSGNSTSLPKVASGTKPRFSRGSRFPTVRGRWKATSTASNCSNGKRMAERGLLTCNAVFCLLLEELALPRVCCHEVPRLPRSYHWWRIRLDASSDLCPETSTMREKSGVRRNACQPVIESRFYQFLDAGRVGSRRVSSFQARSSNRVFTCCSGGDEHLVEKALRAWPTTHTPATLPHTLYR